MKDLIIELITVYGFETVILALTINKVTGIIKMPIKMMARKLDDYTVVTRFIVFLPIIIGFAITCLYIYLFKNIFVINRAFLTLFITSTSLSLTFYAIFEKLFPSKAKIESKAEINASEKILKLITEVIDSVTNSETTKVSSDSPKLVLRGKTEQKITDGKKWFYWLITLDENYEIVISLNYIIKKIGNIY